jgi:DnaJ like chaperone protein
VPFTVGVIALSAKIAKADGVVTRDEVKAFKEAFKVSDGESKHAARVFCGRDPYDVLGFKPTVTDGGLKTTTAG